MRWPTNAVVVVFAVLVASLVYVKVRTWWTSRCPLCWRAVREGQPACQIRDRLTGAYRMAHRYCTPAWARPAVLAPDVWRDRWVRVAEERDRLDALHRPHTLDARDHGYVPGEQRTSGAA